MSEAKHYDLRIHKAAETELASVVGNDANTVMERVTQVQKAKDVTSVDGVCFLRDYEDLIRIKTGEYRVILRVKRNVMELVLLGVGPRSTVYERLEKFNDRELL